jgi:hypothetical protein
MRRGRFGVGSLRIIFVVLSDGLKMVIRRGDVTGCGKMMVLARWVALGVRHDAFLTLIRNEPK